MKSLEAGILTGISAVSVIGAVGSRLHNFLKLQELLGSVGRANAEHIMTGVALSTFSTIVGLINYGSEDKYRTPIFLSAAYLAGELLIESSSASKRGYIQLDQLACDLIGLSLPIVCSAFYNKKIKEKTVEIK